MRTLSMSVSKESRNLAKSKPELVEDLLREAELVVREAPPAVRGDMAQVGSGSPTAMTSQSRSGNLTRHRLAQRLPSFLIFVNSSNIPNIHNFFQRSVPPLDPKKEASTPRLPV